MRYLKYKGVLFESFEFGSIDITEQIFENTKRGDLEGLDSGSSYICGSCLEQYNLYASTGVSKGSELEGSDYICCVEGCRNRNAVQIYFDVENSELV